MKTQPLFHLDTLPGRENDDYKDLAADADRMGRVYGIKSYTRLHKQHLFKEWKQQPVQVPAINKPHFNRVEALIQQVRQQQGGRLLTAAAVHHPYDHIDVSDLLLALAIYLEVIALIILCFSLAFHP